MGTLDSRLPHTAFTIEVKCGRRGQASHCDRQRNYDPKNLTAYVASSRIHTYI
jgi:hypothetical protein